MKISTDFLSSDTESLPAQEVLVWFIASLSKTSIWIKTPKAAVKGCPWLI